MGKKETVEALVDGGKASAAPPLGPALGPMGVNIGQVVAEINKKTESMKGMKVPVKVIIDVEDKSFEIEIGTPPTSALIKKEIGVEKVVLTEEQKTSGVKHVANITMDQVKNVAKIKQANMLAKSLKAAVKEVIGSIQSMKFVTVDNKTPQEIFKDIEAGNYTF
jgi:large subunit ribosomal protein L11